MTIPPPKRRERIVIPDRVINGGFDTKFETDPYNVPLYGMLTPEEYTDCITRVNDTIRKSRSNKIDTVLLITGPLIVPLALWGVRHSGQVKRRKKLLNQAIQEFNEQQPDLMMRWNRKPESRLTIERRTGGEVMPPPAEPVESIENEIVVFAQPVGTNSGDPATQEMHPLL